MQIKKQSYNGLKEGAAEVFRKLLKPQSIVVIGASSDSSKPGGRVVKNIKEHGYEGTLWAVNPKSLSILGLPTFKSIDELPGTPELAIIAIPAPFVANALEDLEAKGVKTVIVLSAGFSEKDEKGRLEEKRLLEIANRDNMSLIGPNCVGVLTPTYAGKFAGIIPTLKEGSVDFISCSGATVDQLMEQATVRGLSFCNIVTTGNSVQIGVEDILALLDDNYGSDSSRILLLYMETLKKPDKLLRHARSLTKKGCTIVGVKSGVTQAGKRAAASHTGAIATNDTAVDALFAKAGIVRVQSKIELIDVACVLSATRGPLKGNRVCIITDAGGAGVMLSDELNRQGLELPVLLERTQERLSGVLPPESPLGNPIDCLPTRNGEQVKAIFKILEEEEKDNIDVIVIITSNSMLRDNRDTYEGILSGMERRGAIPIIPVLSPGTTCVELINKFKSYGGLYFHDEVPIGKALGKIVQRPRLFDPLKGLDNFDKKSIERIINSQNETLPPEIVKEILMAAGFKLPSQIEVFEKEALMSACEEIGFPLVMKVIGPLHKSDVNGVRTGISGPDDVGVAWHDLLKIRDAKGVMVQQMVEGHEVILGASREGLFGHLIIFGLGGIYTEVFKDVRFSLAPLAVEECQNMVRGINGYPMLKGIRGERGMSVELLTDFLLRLSMLVSDFPQIREIDLNPVKGFDSELFAIDARIILD